MKHSLYIYIIAMLIFCGCKDEYDQYSQFRPMVEPHFLSLGKDQFSFSAYADKDKTMLTSDNTSWSFTNPQEWVKIAPMSGSSTAEVEISVLENLSGDNSRMSIFNLQSNSEDYEFNMPVSVCQNAAKKLITPAKKNYVVSGESQTINIPVSSNCEWEAYLNATSSWASLQYDKNAVVITFAENLSQSDRTFYLNLRPKQLGNGVETTSVTITQKVASISTETSELHFGNAASFVELRIKSEVEWTASTGSAWIQLAPVSGGPGESMVRVDIAPNTAIKERSGCIYISIGGKSRIQIPVIQDGIYIRPENTEISFGSGIERKTVVVNSNTSWSVESKPLWITCTTDVVEGNGSLSIETEDNPSLSQRDGIVRISREGLDIKADIHVYQKGKSFAVSGNILDFTDKAASKSLEILTDGTWTANSPEPWIHPSPISNTGNSTLQVYVDENTEDSDRNGSVALAMGEHKENIEVHQSGKYFTINDSEPTFSSKGGTLDLSVSTNDNWQMESDGDDSWLKISKTEGEGDAMIQVIAQDNPSVSPRSVALIFKTIHGQQIRIIVKQNPRFLRVDTEHILFFSKGGTAPQVIVETDAQYKVEKEGEWFTFQTKGNTILVTATGNTEEKLRQGAIKFTMTDLKEGSYTLSLPVIQTYSGQTFIKEDFLDDNNWDSPEGTLGVTIDGHKPDENWDMASGHNFTVNLINYGSDKEWTPKTNSQLTVKIEGYTNDHDWNYYHNSHSVITEDAYEDDTDHSPHNTSNGGVNKSEFSKDQDWNITE